MYEHVNRCPWRLEDSTQSGKESQADVIFLAGAGSKLGSSARAARSLKS